MEDVLHPTYLQNPTALPEITSEKKAVEVFNIVNGSTTVFPNAFGILIYFPTSWSSREKILVFIGHTNSGIWMSYRTDGMTKNWTKI